MENNTRTGEGMGVVLLHSNGDIHFLELDGRMKRVKRLGVIDTARLINIELGSTVEVLGEHYTIIRPSLTDLLDTLERGAQVIHPKDAGWIVLNCGIGPGSTVLEAGSGTGALTTVLAHAVGREGLVISVDEREEHQATARRNITRAGYLERVNFIAGDVKEVMEGPELAGSLPMDAIVLDLPEPERCMAPAYGILGGGGRIMAYIPSVEQVKRVVDAMKASSFHGVRTSEIILRDWTVKARATRPVHDMLGHTAFMVSGRKI